MQGTGNQTLILPGLAIEEHMSTATLSNVVRGRLTEELDQLFRDHYQMVYRTAYAVYPEIQRLS
jgi:hypothetical protein